MKTIPVGFRMESISAYRHLRRLVLVMLMTVLFAGPTVAQVKQPNILVIMADDVGYMNLGI